MKTTAAPLPAKKAPPLRRRAAPARLPAARVAAPEAPALRAKLEVGAANDPFEREAEANAERVATMSAPALPAAADGGPLRRAGINDQPSLDALDNAPPLPAEQETPEIPPAEDVDTTKLDQGDVAEFESGKPDEPEAEAAPAQPARDTGGAAAVGPEGGAAPADVAARVAAPGPGRPLPAEVRSFMEPRFGAEFGRVRVHDAAGDRRAARRIGARAFTHGADVWIGPGESVQDRRLMAHELTHVVQQTGRGAQAPAAGAAPALSADAAMPLRRGWLANKAEKYARQVPGYTLVCVILGKSPITGDPVPRTAENLIGGFMGLVPGGTLLFDRLKEARVLERAFAWVSERLSSLDITWSRVMRLIDEVIDVFPTWHPIREIERIFGPLVSDILTFLSEVKDKILELIVEGALKLAGSYGERVWGIVQQARETIHLILDDPLGFAKNLIFAVVKGVGQFADHALEHLKKGLLGWLFGALGDAGLTLPDKLDFRGLLSIALQILGLTYASFREMLVKALGEDGERKVRFIEKSVEVATILVKEGFVGLWQKLLEMIGSFKETVVDGIKDYVTTSVVKAGLAWLASLTNPFGAIIRIAVAIYDMIVVFLERLDQIIEVATALFSSMGAIARGQLQSAADHVEATMGRTVPVVIAFIAGFLRLGGISASIRNTFAKIRAPADRAKEKMVVFLVKKSQKLLAGVIGRLNRKRSLPGETFRIGDKEHRLYAKKKGRKAEIMVASTERPLNDVEALDIIEAKKIEDAKARTAADSFNKEVAKGDKEVSAEARKTDLDSRKTNNRRALNKLRDELKEMARGIEAAARPLVESGAAEASEDGPLFRAREPRSELEGSAGSYREVKKLSAKAVPGGANRRESTYYEADHVIEKRFPKAVIENLHLLDPRQRPAGGEPTLIRASAREANTRSASGASVGAATAAQYKAGKPFGQLGEGAAIARIDDDASDFPAILVYHRAHLKGGEKGAGRGGHEEMVAAAAKAQDPHLALRGALRKQLDQELAAIAQAYDSDTAAPEAVRQKVRAGLDILRERNVALYGLGGGGAGGAGAAAPPPGGAPAAAEAKSDFTFTPGPKDAGKPDFLSIEGAGGPYSEKSALARGYGDYFETDHIIDKSVPLTVKGLTLGDPRVLKRAQEKAKPPKSKAAARAAAQREAGLGGKPFISGQGLAGYTLEAGFSVVLYRPIHRAITQALSTEAPLPEGWAGKLPDEGIGAVARYIEEGDEEQIGSAQAAFGRHMKGVFLRRTRQHADEVAEEYRKELPKVALLNPGREAQAREQMRLILQTVERSLRDAERRSGGLF
ncbi:DUF4157 domain-containing protein [Roseomonas sp. M0104]|uniref:DUF4157 domain-containing protein n=1 Tax=Teichococcus coralli TaxID=2545983 RepID=A0A845BPN6_9PROT|nr:DUF4157 domain-containing protein [Pseudoroseomonas coralli]MXP65369.1 DUF4157 domain-containing protein [Pseudoroseomonas coralli]